MKRRDSKTSRRSSFYRSNSYSRIGCSKPDLLLYIAFKEFIITPKNLQFLITYGRITRLVITPSGDSLANTANLQMMEKPGGLIRRALGVIPRNMGDHFFALYF